MAGVINELQAIVDYPNNHWTAVVREFKMANEMLRQKRDRLISLVGEWGSGQLLVILACCVGG